MYYCSVSGKAKTKKEDSESEEIPSGKKGICSMYNSQYFPNTHFAEKTNKAKGDSESDEVTSGKKGIVQCM